MGVGVSLIFILNLKSRKDHIWDAFFSWYSTKTDYLLYIALVWLWHKKLKFDHRWISTLFFTSHFHFFWRNVVNLNKTCWSGSLTTWRKIDEDIISCQNKWLLKNKSVPDFKCSIICNDHRYVGEHITAEKLNTLVSL